MRALSSACFSLPSPSVYLCYNFDGRIGRPSHKARIVSAYDISMFTPRACLSFHFVVVAFLYPRLTYFQCAILYNTIEAATIQSTLFLIITHIVPQAEAELDAICWARPAADSSSVRRVMSKASSLNLEPFRKPRFRASASSSTSVSFYREKTGVSSQPPSGTTPLYSPRPKTFSRQRRRR